MHLSIYIHIYFVILHVTDPFVEFLVEAGRKARKIRLALGLNLEQMSDATKLNVSTIKNIEKGVAPSLQHYYKISCFTGISVSDLVNYHKPLPSDAVIKRRIIAFNEAQPKDRYTAVLKEPRLKPILHNVLLKSSFLRKGRNVAEIKDYIEEKVNIQFTSPVISKGLSLMVEEGLLIISKIEGRRYYYKKVY